jgi:ectoine hydroxylase-related dioxygenase (phytanoyl-CoA dioxygenase family)
MRVIPGTHHLPLELVQERTDVESVLGSSMRSEMVDESRAVDVILDAGDVSIHHPNVIHGSEANLSDAWRMGLTIRYIPTSTRILKDVGAPFLLRGRAVPGINTYLPKPVFVRGIHMPFRGCELWNG